MVRVPSAPPGKQEDPEPAFKPSGKFLLDAIRDGDFSRAQGAILAGADVNTERDENGFPALHLACVKGLTGLVRLLLEHKADVHQLGGPWNTTPMHLIALSSTNPSGTGSNRLLMKLLMDYKADSSFLDAKPADAGAAPKEAPTKQAAGARRRRNPNAGFVRGGCGEAVIQAIVEGDVFKAQGLVLAGADLNSCRDLRGNSALHLAAIQGKPGLVKMLLMKSADIDDRTRTCYSTALHLAIENGHHQIVWSLLRSGATVNVSNIHGATPLGLCILDGKLDIVRHLVEAKAQAALNTNPAAQEPLRDMAAAVGGEGDNSNAPGAAFAMDNVSTFLTAAARAESSAAPGALLPHSQPAQSKRDRQIIQEFIAAGGQGAQADEQAALATLVDCSSSQLAQQLLERGNHQTFKGPENGPLKDRTMMKVPDDIMIAINYGASTMPQMQKSLSFGPQLHNKALMSASSSPLAITGTAPPGSLPPSPSGGRGGKLGFPGHGRTRALPRSGPGASSLPSLQRQR